MASKEYHVLGLMSGTSLDGLDLAHCTFGFNGTEWNFRLNGAETVAYTPELKNRLLHCMEGSALDIALLDVELGRWHGQKVKNFLGKIAKPTDFVSSHGHTVFHQPDRGLTLQISSPADIAAGCGLPVVADFRTLDVALGGNGAPLVPVGDKYLFGKYGVCINLGGIANLSYPEGDQRAAYDVCAFNQVINSLSAEVGKEFDEDGKIAAGGALNNELLETLNNLPYFSQKPPKSLGKEWVDTEVIPLLPGNLPLADRLCTFSHHAAIQLAAAIPEGQNTVLLTGGGAHNGFFVKLLKEKLAGKEVVVPDRQTINYKEAIIFAFLGVLRWRGEVNCWAKVTGASADSCTGSVYLF